MAEAHRPGVPGDLGSRHAVFGLEPDAVFIDERNKGDGRLEEARSKSADVIEGAVGGSIEDIEAVKGCQPFRLVKQRCGIR